MKQIFRLSGPSLSIQAPVEKFAESHIGEEETRQPSIQSTDPLKSQKAALDRAKIRTKQGNAFIIRRPNPEINISNPGIDMSNPAHQLGNFGSHGGSYSHKNSEKEKKQADAANGIVALSSQHQHIVHKINKMPRTRVNRPDYMTVPQLQATSKDSTINNGDGTVIFRIRNVAGANSFFLHAIPNRKSATGLMSNVVQIFEWTEPIDANRLPKTNQ